MKRLKTIVVYLIICNIAMPRSLYADQVDDFKKMCDELIASYWNSVRSLAAAEKEKIAPTHVEESVANTAFYVSYDAAGLISAATDYTSEINSGIDQANEMATEFNALTSGAITVDSYQKLIPLSYRFSTLSKRMNYASREVKAIYDSLQISLKQFDGFCERESPLLTFEKTPLGPLPLREKPAYTYINPNEFYRDPVAYAYAEIAGTAALVASIGIYIALYGFSALVAAVGLQATQNGAAITFSGTPAFIPMIVLAVAIAVGNYFERLENEKRKREARDAYNRLVSELEKARAWFEENRLQDKDFQSLALEECKRNELSKNPRTNKPGILFDLKKQIVESSEKILSDQESQAKLVAALEENSGKIGGAVNNYEQALRKSIGDALFAEHQKKVISISRVGSAWDLYNTNIKPLWDKYQTFYVSHRKDCLDLYSFYGDELESPAEATLSVIEGLKDSLNKDNNDFAQIYQMTKEIQKQATDRVDLCIAKMGA